MANRADSNYQPEILGEHSVGDDGEYINDVVHYRFYVEPEDDNFDFDVRQGLEEYMSDFTCRHGDQSFDNKHIGHTFEWIQGHQDELREKGILKSAGTSRKLDIDFVGRRGMFSNLLRASRSLYPINIFVTLCNGTYYIVGVKFRPPIIHQFVRKAEPSRRNRYYRKKFAEHVTTLERRMPDMDGADESARPRRYLSAISRVKYGDHWILQGASIKAERRDSKQSPPGNYVAFETSEDDLYGKPLIDFNKYRTLNLWSMASMAGIPEVICGMRDDRRHRITSIETMNTDQLHVRSQGFWNPENSREKFQEYLSQIKELVQDDDPRAVYHLELPKVEFGPGLAERQASRRFRLVGRKEDDYVILPDTYIRDVLNL